MLSADIDITEKSQQVEKLLNIIIHNSCIKKYCTKQGTKVSSITSGLSKFWRKKRTIKISKISLVRLSYNLYNGCIINKPYNRQ